MHLDLVALSNLRHNEKVILTHRAAALAIALSLLLVLSACTNPAQPTGKRYTGITVTIGTGVKVTAAAPKVTKDQVTELAGFAAVGSFAVGAPIHLSSSKRLPPSGVTLTKTYPVAVPDGALAAFMWWNPALRSWEAVPSTLSSDRTTLTAHVTHFSVWSDFVTGTQSAMNGFVDGAKTAGTVVVAIGKALRGSVDQVQRTVNDAFEKGGNALYYVAGEILTARADAPKCTTDKPSWVLNTTYIADSSSNPLRFCVGSDPKNPELVDIQVVNNRGYAFIAKPQVAPTWSYRSSDDTSVMKALDEATHLDSTIATSVAELTNEGTILGSQQMSSWGFSREQADAVPVGSTLVRIEEPSVATFAASALTQLLLKYGFGTVESKVSALVAFASCGADVTKAKDIGSAMKALLSCIDANDVNIAKLTGEVLSNLGVKSAGSLAGKIVGRLSVWGAAFTAVADTLDYTADAALGDGGRNVSVFTKPMLQPGSASGQVLASLEPVPVWATCGPGIPATKYDLSVRTNFGAFTICDKNLIYFTDSELGNLSLTTGTNSGRSFCAVDATHRVCSDFFGDTLAVTFEGWPGESPPDRAGIAFYGALNE